MIVFVCVLLCLGGFACIIYNATLAALLFRKTQLPFVRIASDFELHLDSNTFRTAFVRVNRLGLIFAGLVLIMMAYASVFGPIL
jgi:hypothetical protein